MTDSSLKYALLMPRVLETRRTEQIQPYLPNGVTLQFLGPHLTIKAPMGTVLDPTLVRASYSIEIEDAEGNGHMVRDQGRPLPIPPEVIPPSDKEEEDAPSMWDLLDDD